MNTKIISLMIGIYIINILNFLQFYLSKQYFEYYFIKQIKIIKRGEGGEYILIYFKYFTHLNIKGTIFEKESE